MMSISFGIFVFIFTLGMLRLARFLSTPPQRVPPWVRMSICRPVRRGRVRLARTLRIGRYFIRIR
jgi:hypothetical protein